MAEFLKLPLRMAQFFDKGKMDTCALKDSIARNLHLIITTVPGENKQDLQYGAQFWEHDYDIHMSNDARREEVISSLRRQVQRYEKRLVNFTVQVNVKQAEFRNGPGTQLRRRIEIVIAGFLARSNEPFRFQTAFFIGPMSFD